MSKGKILVVEDEAIIAEDIVCRLQQMGYEVCGNTGKGTEALDLARSLRPNLVLMDINLSNGIDGVEAAQRIHNELNTPVVFMTAHADAAMLQRAKSCDPYGYIIKPFQEHQIESHIEVALHKCAVEERLRESELQFRLLAEQSPDIVVRISRDVRCLYTNSNIKNLLGMPAEFVIGKTCKEAGMDDAFCQFWKMLVDQTVQTGKGMQQEFQFPTPGGRKIYQVRTAPEFDDGKGVVSLIATVRDVTASRETEMRMHELAQRLVYHVNNSPLAVAEWSADGRCLSWNSEAESLFGWTQAEVQQTMQDCLPLIHPEDLPKFEQAYRKLKSGQDVSAFSICRSVQKNGEILHCEWYLSSLVDDNAKSQAILCLISDSTAREHAEQALLRAKKSLETQVSQRTASLQKANAELKKEIDIRHQLETELIQISEREHRRIGQDLHDGICQELAGIRYSLEAISKQMRNSSPHKSRLTRLTGGVERAIHHTRLLSRGLAPLELENGDLQNALSELAENTATLFQIDCQFELIGRPGQFEIEKATNLFRIAQEALQNATKHAQPTQIVIKLDLSGPNGDGEISVTDNGHGSKPNGNGHGMGLKIMNKRANILGGQLLVEPSEPTGTCVRCLFPK